MLRMPDPTTQHSVLLSNTSSAVAPQRAGIMDDEVVRDLQTAIGRPTVPQRIIATADVLLAYAEGELGGSCILPIRASAGQRLTCSSRAFDLQSSRRRALRRLETRHSSSFAFC